VPPPSRPPLSATRVSAKPPRGDDTRALILAAAERLFAENGITAVSNRQISEAAGQGNNSAVAYHFGNKSDLVVAIVRRHHLATERRRQAMLDALSEPAPLYDWISCLVRPVVDHLAELGSPSWFGRFAAQATTDPALRKLVIEESVSSESMRRTLQGLSRLRPVLPPAVWRDRSDMSRLLIVHTCAERERALYEATATPDADGWDRTADGLVDAITGLWLAPVTAGT